MEAFEFNTSESIAVESAKDKSDNARLAPVCSYSISPTLVQTMPSYLKNVYDQVLQLQGMVRKGRLMSAWIGMPRLVRVAEIARCTYDHLMLLNVDDVLILLVNQSQGFHTPILDTQERELRCRVWWLILELDIQISMHVGRPLAVQVKLGIDQPNLNGVEGIYRDLEQSKLEFTQYALEVLDGLCTYKDEAVDRTYESLVELAQLDRLQRMEKRLPQIPKDAEYDECLMVAIGDYKVELLSFKMMLSCTLAKVAQKQRGSFSVFRKDSHREQKKPGAAKPGRPRAGHRDEAYPHQTAILESARAILESFSKVAAADTYDQYANWKRFFDAFCAAAILAIAHLRQETKLMSDVYTIKNMTSHLQAISNRNPGCHTATVAAGRIGHLLDDVEKDVAASVGKHHSKLGQSAPSLSKIKTFRSGENSSLAKLQTAASTKKRKTGDLEASPGSDAKRRKRDPESHSQEDLFEARPETAMIYGQQSQYMGMEGAFQGRTATGSGVFGNNSGSAATSFDTSTDVTHYPPHATYGAQTTMNNATGTSWDWLHPPLAHPQPPFRDFDEWTSPAYMANDGWQYTRESHYQINLGAEPAAQLAASANLGGSHQQVSFYDPSSAALSMPPTPVQQQPPSTNRYFSYPQPSLRQAQTAAGTFQTGHSEQSAALGENPWSWVQHQHSLTRRNSVITADSAGAPNEAMYHPQAESFEAYEIPTTTGAWN